MAAELTCVLFALRRESDGFRRALPPLEIVPGAPCWARVCGDVLLLETGVGTSSVARTLDWLFASVRPARLLFAGFAGSFAAKLRVGDLLWASEVVDQAGRSWPTTWPAPDLPSGRLLTMPRLIGDPAEKRALGRLALAVDMESALFAERCTQADVPFGCLRAISDDIDTTLSPQLVDLLATGVVSPWRIATALARRPALLLEFRRLARDTSLASRRLGLALARLVHRVQ